MSNSEHEMCINQEQYKALKEGVDEIKSNVKQVHDAVYGNGRAGVMAQLAVAQAEIKHLQARAIEAKAESKGLSDFIRDNMAVIVIGLLLAAMDIVLHFS